MSNVPATFEGLARVRQGIYRIFAAAFLSPEPARLTDLVEGCRVLESMGIQYLAFFREWVPWREAVLAVDDVATIDAQYVRLFATGVAGAISPPIESFYTADPIRGEVGRLLADLRFVYNDYRLEPTDAVADTLDHVSIELEVMSALCAREADSRAAKNSRRLQLTLRHQAEFLEGHLGVWLPLFVRRIASVEPVAFYATLGPAVDSFVRHDRGLASSLAHSTVEIEVGI